MEGRGLADFTRKQKEVETQKNTFRKALKDMLVIPKMRRNKKLLTATATGINLTDFGGALSSEKIDKIIKELMDEYKKPNYLNEKGNLIPYELASQISQDNKYIADNVSIYRYNGIFYESQEELYSEINKYLNNKELMLKKNIVEVEYSVKEQNKVAENDINPTKGYINFQNGIYDVINDKLIEHTADIITLGTSKAIYNKENADIKGTSFEEFIISSLGREYIPVVQEMLAVSMYPVTDKRNYFYMLLGEGRNGKGVLLDIIEQLVPECLRSNIPIGAYASKYENAQIKGKCLNIAHDDNTTRLESIGNFKTITSYEPIYVEHKYKDACMIKPCLTHISSFNSLPSMQEKASAFWDRAILIYFNNTFGTLEEVERGEKMYVGDINLKANLKKEIDIIASWSIEGLKRLMKNNYEFTKTTGMLESKEEERLKTDSTRRWLKERVTKSNFDRNSDYTKGSDMIEAYKKWCDIEGYIPVGRNQFNEILRFEFKGFSKEVNRTKVYGAVFIKL